jgi:hypothetical protein
MSIINERKYDWVTVLDVFVDDKEFAFGEAEYSIDVRDGWVQVSLLSEPVLPSINSELIDTACGNLRFRFWFSQLQVI